MLITQTRRNVRFTVSWGVLGCYSYDYWILLFLLLEFQGKYEEEKRCVWGNNKVREAVGYFERLLWRCSKIQKKSCKNSIGIYHNCYHLPSFKTDNLLELPEHNCEILRKQPYRSVEEGSEIDVDKNVRQGGLKRALGQHQEVAPITKPPQKDPY